MTRLRVQDYSAIHENEVNIGFIDSGIGGLLFAIDAYKVIKPIVDQVLRKGISVNFYHLGDTNNVPYGKKSQEEILDCGIKMLSLMNKSHACGHIIVACNTIASLYNATNKIISDKFAESMTEYRGIDIVSNSAEVLYGESVKACASRDEISLAIFATKVTLGSLAYQSKIEEMHKNSVNSSKALKIYTCDFPDWVTMVELGVEKNQETSYVINQTLQDEIDSNPGLLTAGAIGLFCTHYAFFEAEINNFFKQKSAPIKVLNQGKIFAPNIAYMIEENIAQNHLNFNHGYAGNAQFSIVSQATSDVFSYWPKSLKSLYSEETLSHVKLLPVQSKL